VITALTPVLAAKIVVTKVAVNLEMAVAVILKILVAEVTAQWLEVIVW
jgi:hypothetical protein